MARLSLLGSLLVSIGLAATFPTLAIGDEAKVEIFDDWRLECSADAACILFTLSAAEDGAKPLYRLRLEQASAKSGELNLAFDVNGPRPDVSRAMQWRFDASAPMVLPSGDYQAFGHPGAFFLIAPALFAPMLTNILRGDELEISYLDALAEPYDARFSLRGVSAAFNRLGQLQTGGKPDAPAQQWRIVQPTNLAPVPEPPRSAAVAELGVPQAVSEMHHAKGGCEERGTDHMRRFESITGVLSQTSTIFAIPCTAGPTGVTYRVYIRDSGEIGGLEAATFALYDPRFGWVGAELLDDVSIDPITLTLTASSKKPSSHHCSYKASWVWLNYAFKLQSLSAPEHCAGDRPQGWREVYP